MDRFASHRTTKQPAWLRGDRPVLPNGFSGEIFPLLALKDQPDHRSRLAGRRFSSPGAGAGEIGAETPNDADPKHDGVQDARRHIESAMR